MTSSASMVRPLRRVMICSPKTAGWDSAEKVRRWRELGFLHPPDFEVAQAQHDELERQLQAAGAEVVSLPAASELSLDAVYAHDGSIISPRGMVILHPGKSNRAPEAAVHRRLAEKMSIPVAGKIEPPATGEAGDMLWLDSTTLLVGHGFRTNAAGIEQMRIMLEPEGVAVITAPLPYGAGPSACLHLMSLISLLDEQTAVVDLPWLAVQTVELLRARGYRLIEIDYSERHTLACNVLSLGGRRLLALAENQKTNEKLQKAGFEVRTFSGSELCINGSGGPTCLTRPLARG